MSTAAVAAPSDAWGRSVVHAARRWLVIPIALALLGAVGGLAVGVVAKPSAEALLLVQTDAADGAGMQQAAESAATELNTSSLFSTVAASVGGEAASLQARTTIATKPNSQIVSITVTAPTSAQAVREASAIAEAGLEAGPSRVPDALKQITDATKDLIKTQKLADDDAEKARVSRLGDALGTSQAQLIANANQLSLLQNGQQTRRVPQSPILALMGAAAGALVGIAVALILGARRGTVKSERELSQLYPQTAVIGPSDIQSMITMEHGTSTVFLAGIRRDGTDLKRLTETVRRSLIDATGRDVKITDSVSAAPFNEAPNGHINLVPTTLNETVVRRAAKDERSLLIVPVEPRITRLESLDTFAPRLNDRTYLLVDDQGPEWN